MSETQSPLIFGYAVSPSGEVIRLNWEDIRTGKARHDKKRVWVHLDRRHPDAKAWLEGEGGLDPIIVNALFREETRPRADEHGAGWLINLRGINFNEGSSDDYMIALRIYADQDLIVSTRAFRILAASDLASAYECGEPPATHGDVISFLAERLIHRMEPVIEDLSDRIDAIEENIINGKPGLVKSELAAARRHAIAMRRYMAPQREALMSLSREDNQLLSEHNLESIRETQIVLMRISEELEAVRDRAQIVQEQIVEQRAEEMNTRLFVLSIISAVFLPLGFITGLFGVNVGGMPGVDNPFAFLALCLFMVIISSGLFWAFRKMGWLD